MVILPRLVKNCGPRLAAINSLIIHTTESAIYENSERDVNGVISWFNNEESQVSAHYVIDEDGTIYQCVLDQMVAWHAGRSELHNQPEVNQYSIGIELIGFAKDVLTDEQLEALIELSEELCFKHKIPLNRVVGHSHVAIPFGRKTDPGMHFPWYDFLNTLGARISEREVSS